jgi:hypothetical protein
MKPHKIRSVFSDALLYPPDWVKEIVELSYDEKTILDIIDLYEFYVALIMKCTDFYHKFPRLAEKSDLIWEAYIENIQGNHNVNDVFKEMISELNEFKKNHYYGASIDRIHTVNSYKIINDLTNYCFYPNSKIKRNKMKISDIISNSIADITHSLKLTKGISIYYFELAEYLEILDLLDYFERVKKKINFDYETKKTKYSLSENTTKNEKDEQNITLVQINQCFTIESSFYEEKLISIIEELVEEIKKNNRIISDMVKFKKQLKAQLNEYFLRFLWVMMSINRNKLYMLVEYPSIIPVLDKLIEHNYVDWKNPDHFIWKYKDVKNENLDEANKGKQDKLNMLSCIILDFVFLPTKKYDDYKDYCTHKKFEPFSIGFGQPNLYDNARKAKIMPPPGYKDLLKEIGLKSNWE